MTQVPGWHPDPAGEPERLRHWDGTRWSAVTATAEELGVADEQRPPRPHLPFPVWALALVLVLLLLAGVTTAVLLARSRGGGSTASPTTASAASTPGFSGDACAKAVEVGEPNPSHDYSRLWAARSSIPVPEGWARQPGEAQFFAYSTMAYRDSTTKKGYSSVIWAAELPRSEAFPDPRTASARLHACLLKLYYDPGTTGTVEADEPFQSGEAHGHRYRVAYTSAKAASHMETIILDAGQPGAFDVFVVDTMDGDPAQAQAAPLVGQIRVGR